MINVLLLIAGFIILIKGADFLVGGASSIAKKYGISNLAIGLTVVAFGTSMPEMIVSLLAAVSGQKDASFGNVIGSNNFNLLFILGLAGTIYPLVVQKSTVKFEIPISLLAAGIVFFLVNDVLIRNDTSNMLSRADSIMLLLCFAVFMGYVYKTMKQTTSETTEISAKVYGMAAASGMVALGLVMLIGGGKLVVDTATSIALNYGLSEKLVGLTILAAGTSLPELATSAVAAFKRNTDIAIGNVIGSNIFNMFFILGTTGLINPIAYNTALNIDLYVLLASTILLLIFMFTLSRAKLDRWEAILLLIAYIGYTAFLIHAG